jgi:acyl-CoA synthetase (AMP-forming)/AMP-acid ligase II
VEAGRVKDVVTLPERRATYLAQGLWNEDTASRRLEEVARRSPSSLAVVDGTTQREVSYGELLADVRRFAGYLASHGVGPGDTVSVQLPNGYQAVVAGLGALWLGAILNPLLPNYRARELKHILSVCRTKALVTPTVYRSFDFVEMAAGLQAELPDLGVHVVAGETDGVVSLAGVLADTGVPLHPRCDRPADQVAEVIFTSGTEAAPKAVMHTEQTLGFAIRNTCDWLEMGPDEVVWMPSPVGHSTGLNYGVRLAVVQGYPVVLQDAWDAGRAVELVRSYGCTYTLAATTFLSDLVAAVPEGSDDLASLRLFGCGGAPVPAELVSAAASRSIGVLRLYGSTELLGVSWGRPQDSFERRVETDGSIMSHVEIQVWDDDGRPVGPNEPGELIARSANTSVGFAHDPERTAATFLPGGWVRSGDLVRVDELGGLTVIGRKKEIIIRGGLNIAPREIEDLLLEMDEIAKVCVIGVPNERLGELTCACIVLREGAKPIGVPEVASFLEHKGMAKYKFPQRVELVEGFPMTPSGKVQKFLLRQHIDHLAIDQKA